MSFYLSLKVGVMLKTGDVVGIRIGDFTLYLPLQKRGGKIGLSFFVISVSRARERVRARVFGHQGRKRKEPNYFCNDSSSSS